jgi:hypothetical protein
MRCPSCADTGSLTCAGCHNVQYCTVTCQQTDWQFHKHLCKAFANFSPRPSPEMRRVIFFPTTSAKPEFRWLPVEGENGEEQIDYDVLKQELNIPDFIGGYSPYFTRNNLIPANLDTAIILFHDEEFLLKYSACNPAMLAATNGKIGNVWRGPMLAYCGKLNDGEGTSETRDMDLNTYSDLVAILIDHNGQGEFHSDGVRANFRKGSKFQGVWTNCAGEREVKGAPYAARTEIPRMHPIFEQGVVSEISKVSSFNTVGKELLTDRCKQKIGMPLLLWKCAAKTYSTSIAGTGLSNEKVTFMMLTCDPSDPRFGLAPVRWTGGEVPDVLVTRLDRKPLETSTFEAFGDFCWFHMQPYFEWASELTGVESEYAAEAKKLVMEEMTAGKWERYLTRWRATWGEKSRGADGLAGALGKLSVTSGERERERAREKERENKKEEEKQKVRKRLWDQVGEWNSL